mgnify:CR=1 FL=1
MSAPTVTYDSLKSDIETYVDRHDSEFVSQIPRFIMMCENRLASELRGLGLLRFVTGSLTLSDPTLPKPVRWRETVSFSLTISGKQHFLFPRSWAYCKQYHQEITGNAQPMFYADYDYEHFYLAPTPDIAYSFELAYFERPEPLSDTMQTNWTTRYFPQLIIYGSLLEAAPYLNNPEKLQTYQTLFDRAVQSFMKEQGLRLTDSAVTRYEQ